MFTATKIPYDPVALRVLRNKAEEYNMHNRQNALNKWIGQVLDSTPFNLSPLAGDASFRRYYRLHHSGLTRVVMDAPPDKETMRPFLQVAELLRNAGLRAPQIIAFDETQGFAILEDFGDQLLLKDLCPENADQLYRIAMNELLVLQNYSATEVNQLPIFDKQFILQELTIFREWFLDAYLKLSLSAAEQNLISDSFDWLSSEITQQPQVVVHRDYHSRNLMLIQESEQAELGIIDFQDAMQGPLCYDLVSLLKDCYIQWPSERVHVWVGYFYEQSSLAKRYSLPNFIRAFEFCGLQRHIKVLGVFSRLYLRDNKPGYLQDLPLTLHYVMACLENYEELKPFYQFMQNRINLP